MTKKKLALPPIDLKEYQEAIKTQDEYASEMYCKRQQFLSPEQEQAELCKLAQWQDQISLGIFVCAECGNRTCICGTPSSLGSKLNSYEQWRCGGPKQREGKLKEMLKRNDN